MFCFCCWQVSCLRKYLSYIRACVRVSCARARVPPFLTACLCDVRLPGRAFFSFPLLWRLLWLVVLPFREGIRGGFSRRAPSAFILRTRSWVVLCVVASGYRCRVFIRCVFRSWFLAASASVVVASVPGSGRFAVCMRRVFTRIIVSSL